MKFIKGARRSSTQEHYRALNALLAFHAKIPNQARGITLNSLPKLMPPSHELYSAATGRPWPLRNSTRRNFATISSSVRLFLAIFALLHGKTLALGRTTSKGEDQLRGPALSFTEPEIFANQANFWRRIALGSQGPEVQILSLRPLLNN